MKTINPFAFKFYLFVFNLSCFAAMADGEEDPGLPGEDPGAPAAPIDDWLLPMFIIGVLIVFYYYKKHEKVKMSNH